MTKEETPQFRAKIAGSVYLVVILGGAFAEAFVRQRLNVPGDAAATAANVVANEQFFRWGFAADLIPLLCNMPLALVFYDLFKVVDRSIAALAALFIVGGTAIQGAALLLHIAPLLMLMGEPALGGFTEAQLHGLAYLALRLQANGYTIALVFFGCFGLCIGYLILRSTFLPRVLGVLMGIAGFCYFTNSLAWFVAPSSSSIFFLLPSLVGEGALTLWLLIVGVDAAKWKVQAGLGRSQPY